MKFSEFRDMMEQQFRGTSQKCNFTCYGKLPNMEKSDILCYIHHDQQLIHAYDNWEVESYEYIPYGSIGCGVITCNLTCPISKLSALEFIGNSTSSNIIYTFLDKDGKFIGLGTSDEILNNPPDELFKMQVFGIKSFSEKYITLILEDLRYD